MNRCRSASVSRRLQALLLGGLAWALWPTAVLAQALPVRTFPPSALRATLVVQHPPHITLNGKPAQLSPGARIKDWNNQLVLSASLVGQPVVVNYTTEPHGAVHEVWILHAAEAAEKRPPAAP